MFKLVAKWKAGEDPLSNDPAYFQWVDGRPATRADFEEHWDDTRQYRIEDTGVELWIDPETVGDIAWDATFSRWVLFLPDCEPIPLSLHESTASDENIGWALADLDVLYRVRIHRNPVLPPPPRQPKITGREFW